MYLIQYHKEVGFVASTDNSTSSGVRRWEPCPSPFGGELRMVNLRAALQYAAEHVLRVRTRVRVVDENTRVPVAVFTTDTLDYLR